MGILFSDPLKEMKENQERMMKTQKEAAMRQRQMQLAQLMAFNKDRFHFFSAFYSCMFPMIFMGIKTKNPKFIVPFVPLTFLLIYQYDMVYGDKMNRIRKESERYINEQPELFFPPANNLFVSEEEYKEIINYKN